MKEAFYVALAILFILILGMLSLIPVIRRKLFGEMHIDTTGEDYKTVIATLNEAHDIAEDDDHYYVDVNGELHKEFAHPIYVQVDLHTYKCTSSLFLNTPFSLIGRKRN